MTPVLTHLAAAVFAGVFCWFAGAWVARARMSQTYKAAVDEEREKEWTLEATQLAASKAELAVAVEDCAALVKCRDNLAELIKQRDARIEILEIVFTQVRVALENEKLTEPPPF